jgi:hypothetical protein
LPCHCHPLISPCCPQVRTQTLVKNCIVQIDAAPFKQWYQQHYGVELGQKKGAAVEEKAEEAKVRYNSCSTILLLCTVMLVNCIICARVLCQVPALCSCCLQCMLVEGCICGRTPATQWASSRTMDGNFATMCVAMACCN